MRFVDPVTHLPRRLSVFGRTEGEVVKRLRHVAERIDRQAPPKDDRSRLVDYLAYWLTVKERTRKPSTHRSYAGAVSGLPAAWSRLRLCDLTPSILARTVATMPATRTTALQISVLRAALADAVEWGLLAAHPGKHLLSPRLPTREYRTLSVDEVRRFLEAVAPDDLPLYRLALETGMRQGELFALEKADLDRSRGLLHIRRSLDKTSRTVDAPKTRSSRRSLSLGREMLELLDAHLRRLEPSCHGPLLFPGASGGYIHASNFLRRSFYPALERARLPRIRFHDLRHTAATLWLQAGLHPKAVSERLGHAGIDVTLKVYGHALPQAHTAAAGFLEDALGVSAGVTMFHEKQGRPAKRLV